MDDEERECRLERERAWERGTRHSSERERKKGGERGETVSFASSFTEKHCGEGRQLPLRERERN